MEIRSLIKKPDKSVIMVVGIFSATIIFILIAFLLFMGYAMATEKNQIIETLLNKFQQQKYSVQHNEGVFIVFDKNIACHTNPISFSKTKTSCKVDNPILFVNDTPMVGALHAKIDIETPLVTGKQNILDNELSGKIILHDTKLISSRQIIDEQINNINKIDENLSKDIKQYLSSQYENVNFNIEFSSSGGSRSDIKVLANVNTASFNLHYDLKGVMEIYATPQKIKVFDEPVPLEGKTSFMREGLVLTTPYQLYLQNSRFCITSNNDDYIFNSFYTYYKILYTTSQDKRYFNEFYLGINSENLIDPITFKNKVKELLKYALDDYNDNPIDIKKGMLSIVHAFFNDQQGGCEHTELIKETSISLNQIYSMFAHDPVKAEKSIQEIYKTTFIPKKLN